METAKGSERKLTVAALEAFGTALFVYGILINGAESAGVAFALFASVIFLGGITGGHFNPAVTLAVYITQGEYFTNLFFMILIIAGQILGGLLGVGMAFLSLYDSKTGKPTEGWVATLCPKNTFASTDCDGLTGHFHLSLNTLVNEIVCTFIFISVIMMVKRLNAEPDGVTGALTVVGTLLGMIKTGGRLGACYNPAVGVALLVNQNLWLTNTNNYLTHYSYAYLAGPAFGGLAAGLFHLLHNALHEKDEEMDHKSHASPKVSNGEYNAKLLGEHAQH